MSLFSLLSWKKRCQFAVAHFDIIVPFPFFKKTSTQTGDDMLEEEEECLAKAFISCQKMAAEIVPSLRKCLIVIECFNALFVVKSR